MNKFEIRKLFGRTIYTLTEDGVQVEDRGLASHSRYFVPFETIEHTSNITTTSSSPLFWSTVVFFVLTGMMIVDYFFGSAPGEGAITFWGTLALIFGAFYLFSRKIIEYFPGYAPQPLVFRYPKRMRKDFEEFKESLHEYKLRFFMDRVSTDYSRNGFEGSIAYLIRLRDARILDRTTFAALEDHVNALSQAQSSRYGFGLAQDAVDNE